MSVPFVIDIVTQKTYRRTEEKLGEGGTAKIWRGVNMQDPADEAALKIAHAGTKGVELAQFWHELAILQALADTGHVPWAHRGQDPSYQVPDTPAIIVMELIGANTQLTRLAQEGGGKLPETPAIDSALQYAHLLRAMHIRAITTRGDRKATDIRWVVTGSQQRLVIIDWNRARMEQELKDKNPSMYQEYVRQDIRDFGRLWAELLLGRNVDTLPPMDDDTDPAWASLTRGSRAILARSRGSRPNWGYQHTPDLVAELETHRERLGWTAAKILETADRLRDRAESAIHPDDRIGLADDVLTLIDLARRQGLESDKSRELYTWADKQVSDTDRQVSESIRVIQRHLDFGTYEEAVAAAEKSLLELGGIGHVDLRLARWEVIARTGSLGSVELKQDMSGHIRSLRHCVQYLESAAQAEQSTAVNYLEAAGKEWRKVYEVMPKAAQELLWPLEVEIQIRRYLLQPNRQNDERAKGRWQELHALQPLFATRVRADLERLDQIVAQQEVDNFHLASLQERQRAFARAYNRLEARLQSAEEDSWPDLSAELQETEASYHALLYEVTDADREKYATISWLRDINDAIHNGHVALALHQLSQGKHVAVYSRCQQEALTIIERCATDKGWPDELEKAKEILSALRVSPDLPLPLAARSQETAEELEWWQDHLATWREKVSWQAGNQEAFCERMVDISLPESKAYETVLQEANSARIEIADRAGLPWHAAEEYSVKALLALRTFRHLERALETLPRLLDSVSQKLRSESREWNNLLAEVEQAYQEYLTFSGELQATHLSQVLPEIKGQLEQLSALNREQKRAREEDLPQVLSRATELREALAEQKKQWEYLGGSLQSMRQEAAEVQGEMVKLRAEKGALATEMQRYSVREAQLAVFHTWISAGLQAVRELEKEEADRSYDSARAFYLQLRAKTEPVGDILAGESGSRALRTGTQSAANQYRAVSISDAAALEARSVTLIGGDDLRTHLKLLEDSIAWLTEVYQSGNARAALQALRHALLQHNLTLAETAIEAVDRLPRSIRAGWVVGELCNAYWLAHWSHRLAQERAGPIELPGENPQPILKEALMAKLRQLEAEDSPGKLLRFNELLTALHGDDSLTLGEKAESERWSNWYQKRVNIQQQVATQSGRWDAFVALAEQRKTSFSREIWSQLGEAIDESNQLLTGAQGNSLAGEYLQQMHDKLSDVIRVKPRNWWSGQNWQEGQPEFVRLQILRERLGNFVNRLLTRR